MLYFWVLTYFGQLWGNQAPHCAPAQVFYTDGRDFTLVVLNMASNRVGGLSSPSHTTVRANYRIRRFPISV